MSLVFKILGLPLAWLRKLRSRPKDSNFDAAPRQAQSPNLWTVFVDDNFHYQDEGERYKFGEFDSYEKALIACRQIVDSFLEGQSAASAEALYESYVSFGEDPFIVGPDTGEQFSAWEYAKQRCAARFELR